jgi:hypothetical protein
MNDPDPTRERSPDLRALADIRLVRVEDGPGRGQRLLIARNAAGVAFEVAVDRGFDIAALSLDQVEIGFHSSAQMRWPPPPPDSDNGRGILRSFDGFLVTCGLDYYGPPGPGRVQHGEIWAAQARLIGYGLDDGMLWCEGVVRQAALHGRVLELRRRITLDLHGLTLCLRDRVTNCGFVESPHALLYHANLGWPLLDRGAAMIGPGDIPARFAAVSPVPTAGRPEIVDHHAPVPDPDGMVRVGLHDPRLRGGMGLALHYAAAQLPSLLVWRSYRSGDFALGIEPGTNMPRQDGERLISDRLEAGEARDFALDMVLLRGAFLGM